MKRSRALPRSRWLRIAVVGTALVDLVAKLSAPLSVLALAHGHQLAAMGSAVAVSALGVLRGLIGGFLGQRLALDLWQEVVEAVVEAPLLTLRTRPPEQKAWRIVDAVHRVIDLQAHLVPKLLADASALVVVAGMVVWLLGPGWLLVGAATLVLLGLVLLPGQRAVRRADRRMWDTLTDVGTDLDVLLVGPGEVRAHGREQRVRADLLRRVDEVARAQRSVHAYSALLGLLPVGIALLAATAPMTTRLLEDVGLDVARVAEIGILGGTGLVLGISLVRTTEGWTRALPNRALVDDILSWRGSGSAVTDGPSSWLATIEFSRVGITYPGADVATPSPVDHVWGDTRGLALVGPNGAGKTSLALALLGLIEPTAGSIVLDGRSLSRADLQALRERTVYLPQHPYLAPDRSVAWHLRLIAGAGQTDEDLVRALQVVGLEDRLRHHAARGAVHMLSIPAGELSGGERRRLHLARLVLPRREAVELVILDEPEAGLDDEGKDLLRRLIEDLVQRARVLLIAHDDIPPSGFERLRCQAK